ncbi:MAG TPA: cupin domain-containing protein [Usitatibacter sp.]|nr:cupin domain-containing protein [Usitatibacter sp.]
MPGPVMNIDSVQVTREMRHGDRFGATVSRIAPHVGAKKLGYNLTVVEPGKRAFPFHNHHANEEMFFVIEGTGKLRFGKDEYPLRTGDVVACPPGGPEVAHQIVNTGSAPLRILAVSTMIDIDIWQYPDSNKWGAAGGRDPGKPPTEATFPGRYVREAESLEYWDGE